MKRASWIALLLACVGAGQAAAQPTVYRCGADGRSYSQQPCPEGRRVETEDTRSAGQRSEAAAALRRDAATAGALERERLRAERRTPLAVSLNAPRPLAAADGRKDAQNNKRHGKAQAQALKRKPRVAVSR